MNLKRVSLLSGALAAVAALTLATSPALAKWSIHANNFVTEMTAPAGGTEEQTCPDRLRGAAGWSVSVAPSDPLPPEAFDPVDYLVWKAPPGVSTFVGAQEEFDDQGNPIVYVFTDDGERLPATLVKKFTTGPRTELANPVPIDVGPPPSERLVYTSVDFNERLHGIVPGDVLGLKPTGGTNFVSLTAIDCRPTYSFSGFYPPVDNPPTVNVGTAGRTYPVKFSLTDNYGKPVSNLSAISRVKVQRVSCYTFRHCPTDRLEFATSGKTSLRFDASTGQFVYKWKTYSKGCFVLTVVLADGQEFPAYFQLK